MFPTINIPQALSVYDDLVKAYYGDNRYGGNVAEIYASRCTEYSASIYCAVGAADLHKDGFLYDALLEFTKSAGDNLFSIIELFKQHYPDAKVHIQGWVGPKSREVWRIPRIGLRGGFNHRVHVRVTHPGQKIHGE